MDKQLEKHRDWSNLPNVILFLVLQCLKNTDTDCRRLRAVCTSWRSSLPLFKPPLQFPFKVILPLHELVKSEVSSRLVDYRLLRQSKYYLISLPRENSNAGVWLTRVEETLRLSPTNIWKLQNPISAVCDFKPLPELKAKVNLLDYRISEVATSYHTSSGRISCNTSKAAMLLFPKSEDDDANFSLLTLMTPGFDINLLLFNSGEEKWVNFPELLHQVDIIAYDGKFYATDHKGELLAIDAITCEVKEIIKSQFQEQEPQGLYTYLLESCGKLYRVQKIVHVNFFFDEDNGDCDADQDNGKPIELKVSVLSYSCSSDGDINDYWEPVTSLGDRVFFVSQYVAFSISAQDLSWDKGNCIFFTQEGFMGPEFYRFDDYIRYKPMNEEFCGRISRFFGVYSMEDGRIITADDLPSEYTNIFWPVPSWLAATSTRQQ